MLGLHQINFGKVMRILALLAIRFYQRYVSPHKGFCCAYCAHTGRASCSALGYRAVRRFGVWHGVRVLDARLAKCGVAARRYAHGSLQRQAGFCEPSCDVGDCDASDCFDCDWREKSRKRKKTHVPPRRATRRS